MTNLLKANSLKISCGMACLPATDGRHTSPRLPVSCGAEGGPSRRAKPLKLNKSSIILWSGHLFSFLQNGLLSVSSREDRGKAGRCSLHSALIEGGCSKRLTNHQAVSKSLQAEGKMARVCKRLNPRDGSFIPLCHPDLEFWSLKN